MLGSSARTAIRSYDGSARIAFSGDCSRDSVNHSRPEHWLEETREDMDNAILNRLSTFQDGLLICNADDLLGALDSFGLVQLLAFIQDKFGIALGIEDVACANFGDLDAVIRMIQNQLDRKRA